MKNKLLSLLVLAFPTALLASANVDYLNVDGGIVRFTTSEAKSASSPACVSTPNANLWTVSLATANGRGLYTILATAMSADMSVEVTSGQDCADVADIERAQSVTLVPNTSSSSAPTPETLSGGGKTLYLYKGDGVTQIGVIVNVHSESSVHYLDPDYPMKFKVHNRPPNTTTIYFTEINCTGTASMASRLNYESYNQFFNDGQYFKTKSYSMNRPRASDLNYAGICTNQYPPANTNSYELDLSAFEDPLCGTKACIFKAE